MYLLLFYDNYFVSLSLISAVQENKMKKILISTLRTSLILSSLYIGTAIAATNQYGMPPKIPVGATLLSQIDNNNYAYTEKQMDIVKISGANFQSLGNNYGTLLKTELKTQLQNEEHSTGVAANSLVGKILLNNIIKNHNLTTDEISFINGEAQATGIDFNSLLYMNLSFLFSINDKSKHDTSTSMCSFIAKQTSDTTIVGRNLDWVTKFHGQDAQGPIVITVFNLQDGRQHNKVASIGYLGWFDAATAVNEKGLFAEVNSGQASVDNQANFQNSPGLTSHYIDFLMQDNTLAELQNDVFNAIPNTGYIANIAGAPTSSGVTAMHSIEKGIWKTKSQYETLSMQRDSSTNSVYNLPTSDDLLVATNSFRCNGWLNYLKNPYLSTTAYPSLYDDTKSKSFHRYNNLINLASMTNDWNNDPDTAMKNIMETPLKQDGTGGATETGLDPTNIDYTYYSVVFNTQTKTLYVSDPVSNNGWLTLTADDLFN
jgi:hypothetical protein